MFEQHKPGEDLFGPDGVVSELTKRLMERILEGEMAAHLGYERVASSPLEDFPDVVVHTMSKDLALLDRADLRSDDGCK